MDSPDVPLDRSLPRASYVAQEQFRRERDAVLFTGWFCVGRAESVAGPGDYLTASVAGESIIVVRTPAGSLAGFYNLCRHRGSRLVPADCSQPPDSTGPAAAPGRSGCFAGTIRCPYHGWSYALDGSLRAAPFLPDLRRYRQQLALHPVDVGEWGGFLFARLDPAGDDHGARKDHRAGDDHSVPLDRWLDGVPARLASYPLADRTGQRLVYRVAANWKVILENYNECYHCGPVHPELCDLVPAFGTGGGGLDWDDGVPHREGTNSFTLSGTTSRAPFPGLSAQEQSRHRGELVLPNLMISLSADHVAAFTLWPHAAGLTTVVCDFLFHPAEMASAGFDPSDAVEFWDLVNRQDWTVCEQVQDGMRSRRFRAGYLAPMEQPSADVGRHVASRLQIDEEPAEEATEI